MSRKPTSPREHRLLEPTRLPPAELIEGAEVGVYLRRGSVCPRIGRVLTVRRRTVVLALWGRSDTTAFELAEIAFFRVVRGHAWAERNYVSQRQRRGECGVGP